MAEILSFIDSGSLDEYEKECGYDPNDLDQLTYMMVVDFKYISTDYRVIPGEEIKINNKTEILENGKIRASVNGGEILRCGSKDDFVIVQVDPAADKVYYFTMTEYDEKKETILRIFPALDHI